MLVSVRETGREYGGKRKESHSPDMELRFHSGVTRGGVARGDFWEVVSVHSLENLVFRACL